MALKAPGEQGVTASAALNRAMSEEDLLRAVTDALTIHGWRWTHHRRSDRAILQGHAGFPDICAARRGRVLFIELKRESGKLSEAQKEWQRDLAPCCAGYDSMVIRPSDLDYLLTELA